MSDLDKNIMDEEYEEFETITMTDDETGEDIEFAIIDSVKDNGIKYILVIESEFIDDEQSEAMILKEMTDNQDITYAVIEDEKEFDMVATLFQQVNDEYELEMED